METIARCYEVPAYRLNALRAKVARLARRAERLGCPPVALEVVGEAQQMVRREGRAPRIVDIAVIEVTGPAPRIPGWTFAGVLEHLQADDGPVNILRTLVEGVPERYRNCDPACENCKLARRRNDTYVVRSDAGEWRQVGRQCLADFTGHPAAQQLAEAAEWIAVLDAECASDGDLDEGGGGGGGGGRMAWPLRTFLAHTYEVMAAEGWVSRKAADESCRRATADLALNMIDPPKDRRYERPSDAAFVRADQAIEWLADLAPASDFEWNITAVGRVGLVTYRLAGIAAAIASAHERAMGREAERAQAAAESRHFGEAGKRARFTLRVMRRHTYETDYGAKTAVIFRDEAGNVAVWRATGVPALDVGHRYEVKATVTAHGEYKGVAQTELTRVKVEADLGNPDGIALDAGVKD